MKKYLGYFFAGTALYFGFAGLGYAETTVSAEVQYIFNTLLFLMSGFLVMWMAAGFAMLESGLVTSKSVSAICAKNIGLYSIAGVMFWLVGYNLAYGIPEGGYIGSFTPWSDNHPPPHCQPIEIGYIIPVKIAANKKNGQILILSANVPDTIDIVVAQNTIWKNQSDPSE